MPLPFIITDFPVPTFLSKNVPVAEPFALTTSLVTTPPNVTAPKTVALVVASYTLLATLIPPTVKALATRLAVVVAVVDASV